MRLVASTLLFFFTFVSVVSAQSDSSTFNIRVFGTPDTQAPSTPTLLSATPITANQIDLAWSSSTDNFAVAGYVVTRGTSTIATTTLRSYSDTSVAASTTYTYTIQAFDAAFNYSSSSNSIATTTPDVPTIPPAEIETTDSASEGTRARIVVNNFTIIPGLSTTSIQFKTATPALVSLRWGRTASYELGYVTSDAYSVNHSILLNELEPGTTYQFEITGQTPYGWSSVIRSGTFTTLQNQVVQTPSNIARFSAVANAGDVRLSWQKPKNEPTSYVRIVRSHLGFPRHPEDGAIVYQGFDSSVVDADILNQFSPVYYTAFTYNAQGSVSSGAIAVVYAQSTPGTNVPGTTVPTEPSIGVPIPSSEATSTVYEEYVKPGMKLPELSEIYIKQTGKEFSFIGEKLTLDSQESFTVIIPKYAVAGNLKSIIGTLIDPTDNRKRYSFLLRINADDTQYEADIAALSVQGSSALIVEIYDYEAAIVAKYQTPIEFVAIPVTEQVVFPDKLYERSNWLLLASVLPFALAFFFLILYRRQAEDNRL